jgi:hypothetical protein
MPPARPKQLLLDAGAVFGAHEHRVWDPLCAAYKIIVPATVVRKEAEFYIDLETGERHELDLPSLVSGGTIREYTAPLSEISAVLSRFREPTLGVIDLGEAEAIAYILAHDEEDSRFVTADGPAIEAVCMLGFSDRLMCLAHALALCGHQKNLHWRHSEEFMEKHRRIGSENLVTGKGLAGR